MKYTNKLFGNKMNQVELDDLYKEKVRRERMERQILFEINRLTDDKRRNFERGFSVTPQEKKSIARKINLLEQSIKLKVAQADRSSQALEALEQIIFIKENSQKFEDSGILALMARTSQTDMDKFLASMSLKDAVETGKLDTVRRAMEEEFGLIQLKHWG